MLFWILLALILAAVAFVRLSPSDPDRWHRAAQGTELGEKRGQGSYIWREAVDGSGRERLAQIDRVAQSDLNTTVLAGSVEEGQITYVARSKWMGFPDYVTVTLKEGSPQVLEIYSRLRFGSSDMGVNAARVKRWLAATQG
ncbi:MAG: DUF1499 domain-containing protein [Sulfitobacter sp.]|nr:DUF1499 domain-containing protein [Sulfitobacter sp.]